MTRTSRQLGRLATRGFLPFVALALIAFAGCGATAAATTGGSTSAPSATSTAAPAPTETATAAIPANATTIKITGAAGSFAFQPSSVTIKAGATVVWINDSGAPHTATSDSGDAISWDSSAIDASGGSYSLVFSKPGTYPYHCAFHPFMHGTIIVTG